MTAPAPGLEHRPRTGVSESAREWGRRFDFRLPAVLEAREPPETRGLRRDEVGLMVTTGHSGRACHCRFGELLRFLDPGDAVVINTSGTLRAALPAHREGGHPVLLHLSNRLPSGRWVAEMRDRSSTGNVPVWDGEVGELLELPRGARARLRRAHSAGARGPRLWVIALDLPTDWEEYLERFGEPIRYGYIDRPWPAEAYQTVYATRAGSAEMPSAGRAFTPELVTRLVAGGVHVVPLLLHTGVSSLEEGESPYREWYRVPEETAAVVNRARLTDRRVVAVGTTVVRALETVTGSTGRARGGEGWTDLVIRADSELRSVTSLLTGFHEPRSSHLAILEAVAGRNHVESAYAEALRRRYLWHEFGDLHLLLPEDP